MILRKMKKCVALILGTMMAFSTLAGCGGNGGTVTGKDESVPATGAVSERTEPLEVSMFLPSRLADALYSKDTLTFKVLAEKMNMDFDIETVVNAEAKNKFSVIVASGKTNDVMAGTLGDINKFGMSGAFLPLDDLIDQYAPNLKQYVVDNKEVLAQTAASDGKIYGIPMLTAVRTAMGYCIRQDWLDDLGMEAPVTIDDWYKVLTAFKNTDLNGNGAGDVTPLLLDRAWENYFNNFADAWGIELNGNNDYWMVKDGEVKFAPILPETKEYLATMAKWYKEGLIDQEFITREDTNNYHILNNKAGATCYWTGYIAGMNSNAEVLALDPDTNWQVIAPPVLTEGQPQKTFSQQAVVGGSAWAISSRVPEEKAIEIIKMFDYVYSDEGSMLFNFGVEGESYQYVDGVPEYTDLVTKSEDGLVTWIRSNGMQPLIGIRQLPEYEAASCANDDVRKQLFDYVDNDYFYDINPTLVLTEDEQDKYDAVMSAIKIYVDEELLKFIIGSRPIDDFDGFVARIQEMGIDDAIALENQAYARYTSLSK
ncbi:MAG: extracellular solute-binding protein [Lachnospiraceae bacterium]|nr:extracellular solute-binding protein [Lachnospiraceae bacterium]